LIVAFHFNKILVGGNGNNFNNTVLGRKLLVLDNQLLLKEQQMVH